MFRRLTIRNFRSIEHAEVVLAPFTVVVGPNGSGKSNFVDALVFLRDLAMNGEDAVASRGGISSVIRRSRTRPFDLRLDLRVAQESGELETDYFRHELTIKSGEEGAWRFKKETVSSVRRGKEAVLVEREDTAVTSSHDNAWRGVLSERASAMTAAKVFKLVDPVFGSALFGVRRYRLSPDAMRQPQLASESGRLQENGANVATAIRKLREKDGLASLVQTMCKVVPGLRDIRTVSAGRHELLEFDQDQKGGVATFSASDISEGALRALGVILAAHQMQHDELLVIEEPEANVHAGAAALIFDVLREAASRGAVLITTHSPELLDAASDESILVCSYTDGVTRVGPLDSAQRSVVRDGLFRLAELMRTEPLRIEGDLPEPAGP